MKVRTLAEVKKGERVTIKSLLEEALSHQFLEMGLLPNTSLVVQHKAPLGGPIVLTLQDTYSLSLRVSEARTIEIF